MRKLYPIALGCVLAAVPGVLSAQQSQQHESHASHAGEQQRAIKALDPTVVADYLAGAGMGFALSAELNGYPGPKHVLELASDLKLTAAQRDSAQAIFGRMQKQAVALGEQVVALETELDQRFAHRHIDTAVIDDYTTRIAALNGRLRALHLSAHLQTTGVLSTEQTARYNALRGYTR